MMIEMDSLPHWSCKILSLCRLFEQLCHYAYPIPSPSRYDYWRNALVYAIEALLHALDALLQRASLSRTAESSLEATDRDRGTVCSIELSTSQHFILDSHTSCLPGTIAANPKSACCRVPRLALSKWGLSLALDFSACCPWLLRLQLVQPSQKIASISRLNFQTVPWSMRRCFICKTWPVGEPL